jgi:hypothetical protein
VLVGGASMPPPDALPVDLFGLATRQAVELRDETWEQDLTQLSRALDPLIGGPVAAPPPTRPAATRAPQERRRTTPFLARLGEAFKVLTGQTTHEPATVSTTVRAPASDAPADRPRSSPAAPVPASRARHEIFVSYSSKDQGFADLVRALERGRRVCWIAPRDIPPGVSSWAEPIVTAIANSRLVLVLLTENSIPSLDVIREVTLAADEKIPMLAVSLDRAPLSPALRYFFVAGQRLDLARFEPEEQLRDIVPAVERQLPPAH